MKSETREEAAARMKAMSEAEKEGMRRAQEGIQAIPPSNEEAERRAKRVDEIGAAQAAVLDHMSLDAGTSGGVEEAAIAADTGRDEQAAEQRQTKARSSK